jgi:hypothetical protein
MCDWLWGPLFVAAHMARARLRDRHQDNLRHKLEMLKAQQGVAAEEAGDGAETTVKTEPDSHSEATSIHESSDSESDEKG